MTNSTKDEFPEISIYVFSGSYFDLTKLNFDFLNMSFIPYSEETIKSYLNKNCVESNIDIILEFIIEVAAVDDYEDETFCLAPSDLSNPFDRINCERILDVLKIISPSDISIKAIIDLQLKNNKIERTNVGRTWQFLPEFNVKNSRYDFFRLKDDLNVNLINDFIKTYFSRIDDIKYLHLTVNSYVNSFFESNKTMSFLSLCISTETLINSATELIYRIRRFFSILNTDDLEDAKIIFKNLGTIYGARSKIVHGKKLYHKNLDSHIGYLRNLLSNSIINLIALNEPNLDELNTLFTYSGINDIYSELSKCTCFSVSYLNNYEIFYQLGKG